MATPEAVVAYFFSMEPPKVQLGSDKVPAWARPGAKSSGDPDGGGAAASAVPGSGRILWIVLSAVGAELVIIAAAANQWVSKKIVTDIADHVSFRYRVEQSWLTYNWRLTPQSHLTREWGAQLALDVATLAVSGLLVWALVRRAAATFWRAFLTTWLAVIVATLVGSVIRGLVLPTSEAGLPGGDKVTSAVFGAAGPSQYVFVGAVILGLLSAWIAGVVAVTTRGPAAEGDGPAPPQYAPPEQPPPYYGGADAQTQAMPWQGNRGYQPQAQSQHNARQAANQPVSTYDPQSGPWRQPPPQTGGFPPLPPPGE
jgi:hypothetical protein